MLQPSIRTVSSVLTQVSRQLNDASLARWPLADLQYAYNMSIQSWADRVFFEMLYEGITTLVVGDREYALPAWMDAASIRPQRIKPSVYRLSGANTEEDVWVDIMDFRVEPTAAGGQVLRLGFSPGDDEFRLFHRVRNSEIPLSSPNAYVSLVASYPDADDTTMKISGDHNVGPTGFVRVSAEDILFMGAARDGTNVTLQNLVRGFGGTTAGSMDANSQVLFCVAAPRVSDFTALVDQVCAQCHLLYLGTTGSADQNFHQQMVTFFQGRVDNYWRGRNPKNKQRFVLSPGWTF